MRRYVFSEMRLRISRPLASARGRRAARLNAEPVPLATGANEASPTQPRPPFFKGTVRPQYLAELPPWRIRGARSRASTPASVQKHVGDNGHADIAAGPVGQIDSSNRNRGSHAQQARARHQASFLDRPEIVHLQLRRGEAPRPVEAIMQRAAHGGVGQARGYSAVQVAGAVQQLVAHLAPNSDAVLVDAHQLKSQQVVERM